MLLVRHGESAPFVEGVPVPMLDGHGDPPLDPVGVEQAALVAPRLASEPITAVYVTSLQRTVQTAAPLMVLLDVEQFVEPDLREVMLGEWEGEKLRRYAEERHPISVRVFAEQRWDLIPGAESMEALATRVRDAITRIAVRHAGETVVVFTHGGVIAQVLSEATGSRPFAFLGADNASITHLVVTPDRWIVRRFNDTTHLRAGFTTEAEPLI